jgi:aconitate hydratase
MMATQDFFNARDTFDTGSGEAVIYRISALEEQGIAEVSRLPFSIKVLLEAALRQADGFEIPKEAVEPIAKWGP